MREVNHIDMEMLRLKKQRYRMENETSFATSGEVFVQDSFRRFAQKELLGGRLRMQLPEEFVPMSKEQIARRYLFSNGPDEVHSSRGGQALALSVTAREGGNVEQAFLTVHEALRRLFPQNVFYEQGTIASDDAIMHWLEYKSFGVDDEGYNLQFMTALGDDLLTGAFQCAFEEYDEWRPCAFMMLGTIQTGGEKEAST